MDRIEEWIKDKYGKGDFERYLKIHCRYMRIRSKIISIPIFFASTYLCMRFPFLKFDIKSGFFQKSCYFWSIDIGWRKAFGIQLCKELKSALKRHGWLKKYQITQVKEKYGELVIYDDGAPQEVHDILLKYGYISERTCIDCGRRAVYRTSGWIEPYCEDCVLKHYSQVSPSKFYKDMDWYGWKR